MAEECRAFRLELRQNVDYSILSIIMGMVCICPEMGVDNGNSTYYMCMGKQADTGIVAAEKNQQQISRICSYRFHAS